MLVGEKTEIVFTQPITLADIKPGDFLGVTSRKGPGDQPFDGRDDQTMTNATVGALVQASSGREFPARPSSSFRARR